MAEQTEFEDFEENDDEKTVISNIFKLEAEDKTVLHQPVQKEETETRPSQLDENEVTQSIDTVVEKELTQFNDQQQTQISPGSVLKNRFDLLEVIGQGGMGIVYKALDKRDVEAGNTKFIAIKIINDEFKFDNNLLKALHAETRKTQSLAHPNIVRVFDFDRDDRSVFMTMEFIEGIPLNQVIKTEATGLKVDEAIHLINQMGNALVYAHSQHIIHLDLKPSNIFIDANKHVKVFDFGISRVTNVFQAKGFDAGVLEGLTPSYASLEMFKGESPDPRDDVYALACITYELLTGKHPYKREWAYEALKKKLVPQKISKLNTKQWKTLAHGLALKRKDRIQSVDLFLQGMSSHKSNIPLVSIAIILLGVFVLSYFSYNFNSPITSQSDLSKIVETEIVNNKPVVNEATVAVVDIPLAEQQRTTAETSSAQSMEPSINNTTISAEGERPLEGISNDLTLTINQQVFKIGEKLVVEFSVKKPLYVSMAIINSKNSISMLFPNPFQLNNYCTTGVKYQIPPHGAEFNLNVEGPSGTDQVIAVTSENPIADDLLTQFDGLQKLTSYLSQLGLQYTISSYQITE